MLLTFVAVCCVFCLLNEIVSCSVDILSPEGAVLRSLHWPRPLRAAVEEVATTTIVTIASRCRELIFAAPTGETDRIWSLYQNSVFVRTVRRVNRFCLEGVMTGRLIVIIMIKPARRVLRTKKTSVFQNKNSRWNYVLANFSFNLIINLIN